MRRRGFLNRQLRCQLGLLISGLWLLTSSSQGMATTTLTPAQAEVMRSALHQTLALQFDQALTTAASLEEEQKPTFVSHLTRGMIAYFQLHWQTRQAPPASQIGHRALTQLLEKGQPQLKGSPEDRWLLVILGTAAIVELP